MLKVPGMTLLSESLVQVIFGAGNPSAVHWSVTVSVSLTVMLPEMPLMLGGSVRGLKEQNECDHEKVITLEKRKKKTVLRRLKTISFHR